MAGENYRFSDWRLNIWLQEWTGSASLHPTGERSLVYAKRRTGKFVAKSSSVIARPREATVRPFDAPSLAEASRHIAETDSGVIEFSTARSIAA